MCKMLSSPPPSDFLKIYSEIRKNIKSMLISQEIRNDILRFFPDNPPLPTKKKKDCTSSKTIKVCKHSRCLYMMINFFPLGFNFFNFLFTFHVFATV